MRRVKDEIITDDEFNYLTSQIVMSNDNLDLKSQFTTSSWSVMRRESYTYAEPHIKCVQNNSLEFEGIKNQIGLKRFVLSEMPIAKQAAAQFKIKVSQQTVGQLTQIPCDSFNTVFAQQVISQLIQISWGQNITKNLPDEFRSSLPSIDEIEAELSGVEESQ